MSGTSLDVLEALATAGAFDSLVVRWCPGAVRCGRPARWRRRSDDRLDGIVTGVEHRSCRA